MNIELKLKDLFVVRFVLESCCDCYQPLWTSSHGGHVESQENKKVCFCTVSLALNSRLAEACRAKTKLFIPRDSTWPPSDKVASPQTRLCLSMEFNAYLV